MTGNSKIDWSLWKTFCNETKREKLWANEVIRILASKNILPTTFGIDVGCGTGEFISEFSEYIKTIIGIDIDDYREVHDFSFKKLTFEQYNEGQPDIIFFKQSFHLLDDSFNVCKKYPNSVIVLLQMPLAECFSGDDDINEIPFSAIANEREFQKLGYMTRFYKKTLTFNLEKKLYKQLVTGGYTSYLQKKTQKERDEIWANIEKENNYTYQDCLNIIVAVPRQYPVKENLLALHVNQLYL